MSNTDRVNGFKPVKYVSGAPYNGQCMRFYHAAGTTVTHDLAVGDLVTFSGTSNAVGVPGAVIATAGTGNACLGSIVAIEPQPSHLDRASWIDGADAGYIQVATDPMLIFEAQANAAVAITAVGRNAPMVQTSATSRTTGASGQECNATSSSTASDQLKIVGIVQRADNTVNSTDNKVLVIINNHLFKGGTGSAAV